MNNNVFDEIEKIEPILRKYCRKRIEWSVDTAEPATGTHAEIPEPAVQGQDQDTPTTAEALPDTVRTSSSSVQLGPIGKVLGAIAGAAMIPLAAPVIGGILGTAAGVAAGTAGLVAASMKDREACTCELDPDNYEHVYKELSELVKDWQTTLTQDDRLTAYVAIFNGLALYLAPLSSEDRSSKDVRDPIANALIEDVADPQERELLEELLREIDILCHGRGDRILAIMDPLWKNEEDEKRPSVATLYLFVEAVIEFLEDSWEENLKKVQRYYHLLPQNYRDYILGRQSAAGGMARVALLPRFEKAEEPVCWERDPDFSHLSFQNRQLHLYLRVPLFYTEGKHMSVSAKLMALVESQECAYMAAEGLYSMQSILRDFAHTYGNMKTSRLTQISNKLFQAGQKYHDEELSNQARLLLLEAQMKHNLSIGIQLMHLRCREDIDQLRSRLSDSMVAGTEDNAETITDILDFALKQCLYRVFYDASDRKAEIARKKLISFLHSWPDTVRDFEKQVLLNDTPCIQWLRSMSPPLEIDMSISPEWESLRFFKDSFASVLFEDLLAELIFNALKYGGYAKPIQIKLGHEDGFLRIDVINSLPEDPLPHIQGSGLESRNETLRQLNGSAAESLTAASDESGHFCTTLRLRRELFYPRALPAV